MDRRGFALDLEFVGCSERRTPHDLKRVPKINASCNSFDSVGHYLVHTLARVPPFRVIEDELFLIGTHVQLRFVRCIV